MNDSIRARANFLEIQLRHGGSKLVAPGDVKSIQPRREGGTCIRLQNDHIILVSCRVGEVVKALELATEGVGDRSATA